MYGSFLQRGGGCLYTYVGLREARASLNNIFTSEKKLYASQRVRKVIAYHKYREKRWALRKSLLKSSQDCNTGLKFTTNLLKQTCYYLFRKKCNFFVSKLPFKMVKLIYLTFLSVGSDVSGLSDPSALKYLSQNHYETRL